MNFLKKLGLALVKISGLALGFMGIPFVSELLGVHPQAGAITQTVFSDLNAIAGIITTVEATFAAISDPGLKTGSQKLQAAAPQIQQVLLAWAQSNLPGHNKVVDPVKLQTAATQIAGGMADLLSAFGD